MQPVTFTYSGKDYISYDMEDPELPQEVQQAYTAWLAENPTPAPAPTAPTIEQRTAALEDAMLAMMLG